MQPPKLLSPRQITSPRIFWLLLALAAALFIYYLVIIPWEETKKKAEEEILLKRKIIAQYNEILLSRPQIEMNLEKAQKQIEEINKKLISGDTLQLAAANLQDMVKKIAEKNFVSLRSFRILEPKDIGPFRQVSLQIEFLPINSMLNLILFIADLENQEKLIIISDMDLLIINPRMPNALQGNLMVSAYMKGSKHQEKSREK